MVTGIIYQCSHLTARWTVWVVNPSLELIPHVQSINCLRLKSCGDLLTPCRLSLDVTQLSMSCTYSSSAKKHPDLDIGYLHLKLGTEAFNRGIYGNFHTSYFIMHGKSVEHSLYFKEFYVIFHGIHTALPAGCEVEGMEVEEQLSR